MVAAFISTLLFSVSVICGHRSARLIGGTEANFWRVASATLFLAIWAYGWGGGLGGPALPLFVLSGIAGIGVGDVALFQALPRLGPRLSMLLVHCLTAPIAASIEWVWLGTSLTWVQLGCIGLILIGVGIALEPGGEQHGTTPQMSIGVIFSLIAASGGAVGAVLSRKAYGVAHAAMFPIDGATAGFQRVVGGLFIAGLVLLVVKRKVFRIQARAPHHLVVEASKRKWRGVWIWILVNSLAGQTVGVSFMQLALESTPTGVVMAIIALTPITVIPLARVFEGEKPTTKSLVGAAVAVAGVVVLALARK